MGVDWLRKLRWRSTSCPSRRAIARTSSCSTRHSMPTSRMADLSGDTPHPGIRIGCVHRGFRSQSFPVVQIRMFEGYLLVADRRRAPRRQSCTAAGVTQSTSFSAGVPWFLLSWACALFSPLAIGFAVHRRARVSCRSWLLRSCKVPVFQASLIRQVLGLPGVR